MRDAPEYVNYISAHNMWKDLLDGRNTLYVRVSLERKKTIPMTKA